MIIVRDRHSASDEQLARLDHLPFLHLSHPPQLLRSCIWKALTHPFSKSIRTSARFEVKICRILLIVLLTGMLAHLPLQAQTSYSSRSKGNFTIADKIASIGVGAMIGAMCGGIIGGSIGNSKANNGEYADAVRGALIGGSIMSFLIYEDWARRKGVTFPLNTWYAVIGGNTTFSNHDATTLRPGFLFGIGRNYYLSEAVYLQGEAVYNQRRFLLPAQRIRYGTFGTSELWYSDINFSEAYVDVALLTKVRIIVFANAKLSIALGPALSVPILDTTSYDVQTRERVEISSRVPYDFSYNSYEPGPTSPYFGFVAAIEFETNRLSLKTSLNHALYTSNQIYPLRNETRLSTLMLALGYRL